MYECLFNVRLGPLHKHTVVIRIFLAKVEMHKRQDVDIGEIPMIQNI
jgi:hypothetical protein